MSWMAEFIFKIGYCPIQYQSVKGDFLSWYYQAVKQNSLSEDLDLTDAELVEEAINAGEAAKRLDKDHPVIEVIDKMDDYISRLKCGLAYVAAAFVVIGMGSFGISIFKFDSVLYDLILGIIGSIFGIPPIVLVIFYSVLSHQLRTSSQVVAKFNSALVVPPAKSNENIRHRDQVTAEYLWNSSLLKPKTIIVLVLLGVTKFARPGLYGTISTELKNQVGEFAGGDAKEIIKTELGRAKAGKFGTYEEQNPASPAMPSQNNSKGSHHDQINN